MSSDELNDKLPSESYCPLPWSHLYIDPVGAPTTCCMGDPMPSQDELGVTIKAGQRRAIDRHLRSPRMRGVREDMLAGRRPAVCAACWKAEDRRGQSYREQALRMSIPGITGLSADAPAEISFIDLRLGNFCNLKCRMCVPYSSKTMIPEYRELQDANDDFWEDLANLRWFESDVFWEDLAAHSRALTRLHLAGGEPLLIKKSWDYLRRLIDSGRAEHIDLAYNTNLTAIPKWAAEIWSAFRSVHLFISVDGIRRINEFIRHPIDSDTFERNLRRVEEDPASLSVSSASIHTTAQIYNVFSLPDFFRELRAFRFISRYPQIGLVTHPEAFDIRVLPASLKAEAAASLEAYLNEPEATDGSHDAAGFAAQVMGLVEHMLSADHSDRLPDFRRMNEVFDRNRDQRASDVVPQLARVLS
ncbi:MAG: twitch domain-containing radical SAM protein [Alphaproteobacteria bacterium]|nr:twitch domain-containing radical SAM protein [Alphaproteobacteria bacterium]